MTFHQLDLLADAPMIGQIAADVALTTKDRERARIQHGMKSIFIMKMPDMPAMTWGGRGQQPRWIRDWLAAGNKLEPLLAQL
ncbi:H-NS family nucleoid-associated regulatory protein [Aquitalea magnusonii]|uniref:H-NS histone family protein n=1 Tax=Aquitalea magnusonii TaxID=332411 RepID=A0A318JWA1_9NEIS|nr:H-NS family nucleoid-associated regulatory protein [Aquitalea magnusonii]PXX49412.1 H-NS histone family protein [Aquitalea magnusonii]